MDHSNGAETRVLVPFSAFLSSRDGLDGDFFLPLTHRDRNRNSALPRLSVHIDGGSRAGRGGPRCKSE